MKDLLTLEDAVEVCQQHDVSLKRGALQNFAAGRRKPKLPSQLLGKTWIVNRKDLIKWIAVYKKLPPRGVRRAQNVAPTE